MVVIVEPVRVSCDLPHIPIEKGSKVDGTMRKPVYLQEGSPQLSSAELYFVQVDVLEYYPGETVVVRSATEAHMLPAVLRVRVFVQREWSKAPISLSRRNIMLRDKFSCQCASMTPHLGPYTLSVAFIPRSGPPPPNSHAPLICPMPSGT